ncbi:MULTISPECIES: DUF736 domain-containing protein [Methylosinus]|uniref:DUF736 domain-containing protein n=1 Tax=Methylosinus trichosporium (strain ATCC 35070 / NCIMB 11131 / UNIQEM 75 / OB3b) TaxID=595536 RepID=A0A2D2D1N5_METT3|nr:MULTISPECIES: DUF736 domain-containing protein [Methylosinus]ATQ68884.1 DUF736 domain-containing protein [Methylosinus trichosporium OB3b]OBS52323.1 hypothetical protein A8B73_12110 [Methylosinus sp. 3S-1]
MTQIGRFTRTTSGYSGAIRTLSLDAQIILVLSDHGGAENAPDYRILLDDDEGPEIGAAWKRVGEKAGDYVSLLLDDPALAQPIRANLFQSSEDKSSWLLHWTRLQKRSERD